MPSITPGRLAAACLALLPAAPGSARAGDHLLNLFHHKKGCGGCVETQRVTLPARQVEVVTEQPRVVVRDMAPRVVRHRAEVGVAPLAVGTVYMPMTLPVAPMVGAPPVCPEPVERNPLEAAHRAELMALRSEQARIELQATMDAHQRVMQRVFGSSGVKPAGGCDTTAIETRLNQLTSELEKLNNRVTAIEKLLVIHDNVLRDKVMGAPAGTPAGAPAAPVVSEPGGGTTIKVDPGTTPGGTPPTPPAVGTTPPPMIPPVPSVPK